MTEFTPFLIPLTISSPSKYKQFLPLSDKILVFDIDNTLYCSSLGFEKFIRAKINDFVSKLGIKENVSDMCAKYTREYGLALKGILLHYPQTDPQEFFRQVEGNIDISEYIKRDEELINILEELKGYKMYCFTNAYYPHAVNVLNVMGLSKYFSGIFYCNYTTCGTFLCKPDEHAYKLVGDMLGNKTIYFYDDKEVNVEMGNQCGWICELIGNGYDIKMALKKFMEQERMGEVKNVLLSDIIAKRYAEGSKKSDPQDTNETNENKI